MATTRILFTWQANECLLLVLRYSVIHLGSRPGLDLRFTCILDDLTRLA